MILKTQEPWRFGLQPLSKTRWAQPVERGRFYILLQNSNLKGQLGPPLPWTTKKCIKRFCLFPPKLNPILGLAGFGLVQQISLMSNNFHNNKNNIDNNNDNNNNNKNSSNNKNNNLCAVRRPWDWACAVLNRSRNSSLWSLKSYKGWLIYIKTYMPIDMHQDT